VTTSLLLPGDGILYAREGDSISDIAYRWIAGPDGHAALYRGQVYGEDWVVEAIGRGVLNRRLACDAGRMMTVIRLKDDSNNRIGRLAANEALHLADNPDSLYDAPALIRYVIPRLVLEKVTGIRYGFGYSQDKFFYCPEVFTRAYENAGYRIWPPNIPPVPSDFRKLPMFRIVLQGRYPDLEPVIA